MPLLQPISRLQASSLPESATSPTRSSPVPFSDFQQQIEQEFITGSAISPALFTAAVEVVPDLVEQPGGEVETPIHNALNWQYSRFGHQVKASLYGAILRNEDGSCWQVKLSQPLQQLVAGFPAG